MKHPHPHTRHQPSKTLGTVSVPRLGIPAALAVLALLALAASACGSGSIGFQIGGQSVEEAAVDLIETELAEDFGTELTGECPEVSDPEVGTEFTCTATTPDGEVIPVDAVIDREDHIALTAAVATPATIRNAAIEAIEGDLAEVVGADLTAECPEVDNADEGSTFSCTGTLPDGSAAEIEATVGSGADVGVRTTNVVIASALPQIEAAAAELLVEQIGADGTVDCGGAQPVVLDDTNEIDCVVTNAAGATTDAKITMTDLEAGTFTIRQA